MFLKNRQVNVLDTVLVLRGRDRDLPWTEPAQWHLLRFWNQDNLVLWGSLNREPHICFCARRFNIVRDLMVIRGQAALAPDLITAQINHNTWP